MCIGRRQNLSPKSAKMHCPKMEHKLARSLGVQVTKLLVAILAYGHALSPKTSPLTQEPTLGLGALKLYI